MNNVTSKIIEINLKNIKYYGSNDIATNLFVNDYESNSDFILNLILSYNNYNLLINNDFILGFYTINLFLLQEDIIKDIYPNINIVFKENYNSFILKTKHHFNIKNITHLIELMKKWILNNLYFILSRQFLDELKKYYIFYDDIINLFLKSATFDNEKEVKNFIILLNKCPKYYSKILDKNLKFEYKPIISKYFILFLNESMKNNENLIQNFNLVDCYISLTKDKEAKEKILLYCKKEIDSINEPLFKIKPAEYLINIVKKYRLIRLKCTKGLELWYNNLKKEILNSKSIHWQKMRSHKFDKVEFQNITNQQKNNIKNNKIKTWFYNSNSNTAFLYPLNNNLERLLNIFDNKIGTYSQNKVIDIQLYDSFSKQMFACLFLDRDFFKLYTSNFAKILECFFYSLGLGEKENIFCIERYYKIIEQITNEDDKNTGMATLFRTIFEHLE